MTPIIDSIVDAFVRPEKRCRMRHRHEPHNWSYEKKYRVPRSKSSYGWVGGGMTSRQIDAHCPGNMHRRLQPSRRGIGQGAMCSCGWSGPTRYDTDSDRAVLLDYKNHVQYNERRGQ